MALGRTILIVEDNTYIRDLYKELLINEGYEVEWADNGKAALVLTEKIPDLVLLDIMLPGGMHGFDILEQMRRNAKTKSIPVFILTNLDSERESAMKIGAQEYFVKVNTTPGQLLAKIKEYFGEDK